MVISRFVTLSSAVVRLVSTIAVTILLLACGDGSDNSVNNGSTNISSNSSDGVNTGTASKWVVNGFHLVSSTTYDSSDTVVKSSTYEYDLERNEISQIQTGIDFDGNTNTWSSRIIYNDRGDLVESIYPYGDQFERTEYTFNSSGLLIKSVTSGPINRISDFEYNAAGDLIRRVRTDLDEQNIIGYEPSTKTYDYDENGNLKSSVNEVQMLVSFEICVATTDYTNNNRGQLIEKNRTNRCTDSQTGQENYSFTTEYTYAYDSNGNMVERTVFSAANIGFDEDLYDRTTYVYAENPEQIYNHWLRIFKYYP